jgi:hypothetical protein
MKKNKTKLIKELAAHFEEDLQSALPITVKKNGVVAYKDYEITLNSLENWSLLNQNKTQIGQFFLKTSAIMAAKAWDHNDMQRFHSIKSLDTNYWTNYTENLIYKKNIKKAKDFDRFMILLNKLENSEFKATHFKNEISKTFKRSFV